MGPGDKNIIVDFPEANAFDAMKTHDVSDTEKVLRELYSNTKAAFETMATRFEKHLTYDSRKVFCLNK